jgi:hypothetical protein
MSDFINPHTQIHRSLEITKIEQIRKQQPQVQQQELANQMQKFDEKKQQRVNESKEALNERANDVIDEESKGSKQEKSEKDDEESTEKKEDQSKKRGNYIDIKV